MLKEPEQVLSSTSRLKGLDGNEKMGKSLGNAIFLIDDYETISKKVMSAITDPEKIKKDDKANPNVCMVYYYHKLVTPEDELKIVCDECKNGCRGCVQCKKQLIKNLNEFLEPIKNRRKIYEENPELVEKILNEGTVYARNIAKENMKKIKEAMKIDY